MQVEEKEREREITSVHFSLGHRVGLTLLLSLARDSDEFPDSTKSVNAAKGQILFLAANTKLVATTTTSDFVTYRCSVSDRFFL